MKIEYTSDLLIFGIDSRVSGNVRSLPKKYFSILLVKRSKEPFNNKWCLPGGYVNNNETSKYFKIRFVGCSRSQSRYFRSLLRSLG